MGFYACGTQARFATDTTGGSFARRRILPCRDTCRASFTIRQDSLQIRPSSLVGYRCCHPWVPVVHLTKNMMFVPFLLGEDGAVNSVDSCFSS